MSRRSTPVHRAPAVPPPAQADSDRPGRRIPHRAAVATVAVFAAVLAVALSGCGIRDTAVPVDAGVPASRTACPPAPNASLTALERDASMIPTSAPTRPWPAMSKEEAASAAAEEARAKAAASAAALAAATPSLTPSAVVGPTASDGTLACLHPGASG